MLNIIDIEHQTENPDLVVRSVCSAMGKRIECINNLPIFALVSLVII